MRDLALQSHNARGTGPMSVVRLDEEDLDEEDLAILREVASKGGGASKVAGTGGASHEWLKYYTFLVLIFFVMWV